MVLLVLDRGEPAEGTVAGAVLADVGELQAPWAGARRQKSPAILDFSSGVSFQSRPPVMSVSGRLIRPVAGVRAYCGQVEGPFVLGSDGGVEQAPVAQAHLGGHVAEQHHQGLQGDAGVDQGGGVGVAELVRGDVVQARDAGGSVEFGTDRVLGEARPW